MADNKYQRGKIYRIVSDQTDQVYIGSTTEPALACRMRGHRKDYRKYIAGTYHRVTSFDILQYPDAQILLLENYPCQNKDELFARERFHIESTPNCVNYRIPGRTRAEYREASKEVIAARNQEYYDANKAVMLARMREYRETNKDLLAQKAYQPHDCPCGGKYTNGNKASHERSKKHQAYLQQAKKVDELLNQFVQELGL